MIEFANVDGDFCLAEQELILAVAEKLGFTKEELNTRLNINGS
jgi:hypothetical protein